MRKLIEMRQEYLITCDSCEYKIKGEDPNEEIIQYINKPCPECGENLLTPADYINSRKVLNYVNWLNKWFSWITLFIPKNAQKTTTSVKCHDGIKINQTLN